MARATIENYLKMSCMPAIHCYCCCPTTTALDLFEYLHNHPEIDVNMVDQSNTTAMHYLLRHHTIHDRLAKKRILLDFGADMSRIDCFGNTCSFYEKLEEHFKILDEKEEEKVTVPLTKFFKSER